MNETPAFLTEQRWAARCRKQALRIAALEALLSLAIRYMQNAASNETPEADAIVERGMALLDEGMPQPDLAGWRAWRDANIPGGE